jgi:hypothetical protein
VTRRFAVMSSRQIECDRFRFGKECSLIMFFRASRRPISANRYRFAPVGLPDASFHRHFQQGLHQASSVDLQLLLHYNTLLSPASDQGLLGRPIQQGSELRRNDAVLRDGGQRDRYCL